MFGENKLYVSYFMLTCMIEVLTSSNIQGSPDLKAAREVADYIGTRHHEFHFTVQVMTVFITPYLCISHFFNKKE